MEKAASKAMGALKVAKAGLNGIHGVFRTLMKEHGEATVLVRGLTVADEEVRRELYPKVRQELLSHERAERAVVYAELGRYEETRAIVDTHNREAGELEEAIRAVDRLEFSDAGWQPAFVRVAEMVTQHVEEEEGEFFPMGQRVMGRILSEALDSRYRTAKERIVSELAGRAGIH